MQLLDQLKEEPKWQRRRELVYTSTDATALLAWLPYEKEGWVRVVIATVLGKLGGPAAHKALERLTKDDSGMVRIAAVSALNALQTLEARFQIRETYLQEDDPLVRRAMVESQVPVGEPAGLEKLYTTLAYETDPYQRALAIYNATLDAGKAIIPNLRELWKTETEPVVRQMLADLLATLGGDEDRQLLLTGLLQEPAFQVRRDIIQRFTRWGGSQTRQAFLTALPQESNEILQIALIRALGKWKERAIVCAFHTHQLSPCSTTISRMIHETIKQILESLSIGEFGSWLPEEPEAMIRVQIVKELQQRGETARETVLAALPTEQNPNVREQLIKAVAVWGDEEEIRTLLYECLRRGEKSRGIFTILRILAGHYPSDELAALAKPYLDPLASDGMDIPF